jgi:ubiquinol-cytochrome c reductase cytochrome c1 subunit
MKKLFASLAVALWMSMAPAIAAQGGYPLDKFPVDKMNDMAALQNGAKIFVNYCLNCHAAGSMRYNRMRDIGLTEDQIKKNLMFASEKVGETMNVAQNPKQAVEWFGANPPDLSVIARSRASGGGTGADYLYTYLRTYYRDPTKATGWNNLAFPSVGMPHVLWELQGQQKAIFASEKDAHDPTKTVQVFKGFEPLTKGSLNAEQYNNAVADLVAYLQWMGEPNQAFRARLGVWVLLFLGLFTLIAWRMNASFWKDVK